MNTAIANGNFKILVKALQVTDLVNTLQSSGPFTFFAPTDAAFAKLSPGFIDELLKPENKLVLTRILAYYVVSGNLTTTAIKALHPPIQATNIVGQSFLVTNDGSHLKVNNATVIIADVFATNGVIHAIDTVLLSPTDLKNIFITISENGNFRFLAECVLATGLSQTLQTGGPFTLFAPTEIAFAKLTPEILIYLLSPQNRDFLVRILLYHLIPSNLTAAAIKALNPPVEIKTLNDHSLSVTENGNELLVNGARVLITDVFATNGIIHGIDTLLIPPAEHISDARISNWIALNRLKTTVSSSRTHL